MSQDSNQIFQIALKYKQGSPTCSKYFYIAFTSFVVGLERGPLILVMITEELFQGNGGFGLENRKLTTVGNRCADHATPSIR
jgi:hypothetical protein